jgi:hypothetical protein
LRVERVLAEPEIKRQIKSAFESHFSRKAGAYAA